MEYKRKIIQVGNSLGMLIPQDVCEHLGVTMGSKIIIKDDEGKHGKFIAVWEDKNE